MTAAIGYGLATFATVLANYWFDYTVRMDDWFGFTGNVSIYVMYIVLLSLALLVNMFNVSITSLLNQISAYWHMVGVVVIVLVLIIVPDNHQSFSYVFSETVNNSGFETPTTTSRTSPSGSYSGSGSCSQYTITGFDASAHTAEETHHASRFAAVGMYMSVVVSVVFGWILLLAVTFQLPSTQFGVDLASTSATSCPSPGRSR